MIKIVDGPSKPRPVRPELPSDGSFILSTAFAGAKPGYVFTTRPSYGTGYYRDGADTDAATSAAAAAASATSEQGAEVDVSDSAASTLQKPMGELTVEVPSRQSSLETTTEGDGSAASGASGGIGYVWSNLFEREPAQLPSSRQRAAAHASTAEPSPAGSKEDKVLKEFSEFAAQNLEAKLEAQRSEMEAAAMEAVNAMLSKLKLPTLKQALQDLGLPAHGDKAKMTQRLSERALSSLSARSSASK